MFKNIFIAGLTATAILVGSSSGTSAAPMGSTFDVEQGQVLVNNPNAGSYETACFGCISPSTGRVRDNYVRPHYRSNGSHVSGYWRS
jgi:hypothetical protein